MADRETLHMICHPIALRTGFQSHALRAGTPFGAALSI
jgi:hypothetical protein